jgi:hypothetical protein
MASLFPITFFIGLGVAVIFICANRLPPTEKTWIIRILTLALLLRIAVCAMFVVAPETRLFHEDAQGYEDVGMATAAGWKHEGPPLDPGYLRDQNYGYFFVTAGLYYLLGNIRITPSLANAVLGVLNAFLVYALAARFFHARVARRALLMICFMPSIVLWNSVALKDTMATTLILIALSSCIALKERFSLGALAMTGFSVVAMHPLRFYLVYFLVVAIAGSMFFERGLRFASSGIAKQVAIGLTIVGLMAMAGWSGQAAEGTEVLTLERVSGFRQGMADANSGFAADVDISTPGRALAFLPLGTATLLLAPFPWQMTSLRSALAAPETIYWWFLIPSLIRGLRFAWRRRFRECSPILLFTLLLTVAYSLVHGNVGSGFRQRAQIFVFLFIFASLGGLKKRLRRVGASEDLLLRGETQLKAAAS